MSPSPIDPRFAEARELVRHLRDHGYQALLAGGCVRDHLLGVPAKDFDIATDARPDDTLRLFPGSIPIGKAFGVILVKGAHADYEVATFRKDAGYEDGRRPVSVTFSSDREDAQRRDFTINGMFLDPLSDEVIDYVDGRSDLTAHIIRAIGDPALRFGEDYLRMLRAVRFASVFGFRIEPQTFEALQANAGAIVNISAERVQQELSRILCESPRPGDAVTLLDQAGLLRPILPEVADLKGVEQPPQFHPEGDVFVHTMLMLNLMKDPSRPLAYSVLLHDIGKPSTFRIGPDRQGGTRIRFDGHDQAGAVMAEAVLARLRLPRRESEAIVHCVRNHMKFMHVPDMRSSTLRKLIGAPTFPVELELHRLDCLGSHGDLSTYEFLLDEQKRLAAEPVLPDPWITGRDLIRLGMKEGPAIGRILKLAYEQQLEGAVSSREELLAWAAAKISESA